MAAAQLDERPWLSQYDAGVPASLAPYPSETLIDIVRATAGDRPNEIALMFKGARISYRELDTISDSFGRGLRAIGVAAGDRLALLMPNSPQAIVAQLGGWKAGAIVAPMNPLYTETELERALKECGAQAVVTLSPFYGKVLTLRTRTDLRHVVVSNIKEFLPPAARILFSLFKEAKGGHRVELADGDRWLPDVIRLGERDAARLLLPAPDDPALLLFTGGTTGIPKAALGTHRAIVQSAMQTHAWFRTVLDEWHDRVLLAMPLFHVYGNIGIFASSVVGHLPLVLVPNPRDLTDLVHTIEKSRVAFFPAVPTLLNALLEHPRVKAGRADFSSLKLCISGAAPLLPESRRRFEALTHGRIVDAYSITEAMNAAIIAPVSSQPRPGAIGVPLPDVELRIIALDGAGDVRRGEDGEILLRAPQLMVGYWGHPEETAKAIVDGWLHTGDIGHLDDDGFVHITDRKKDMIKTGGFAVWPREVEEVLAAHPAVAEVGVVGVPDQHRGEAVIAWIALRRGASASAEELQSWCRERLAPYKVPRRIELRDALPKSDVGKVLRRSLATQPTGGRTSTVAVNGAALSVEERGSGPEAVVFAHGLLLNKRMFDAQMEALRERYRCVAFDFRGHGASDVTNDGYGVDALTDDAIQLIERLRCAPCHFVGHSLGAFVGIRIAARRPELIRSLVLLAPSADPQPTLDVLQYRMLQVVARAVGIRPLAGVLLSTLFGRSFLRDPRRALERDEWRRRLSEMSLPGALRAVDGVLARHGVRDELSRIAAPTLVVAGGEDAAAPPRVTDRVVSGIPGARSVRLPNAGHSSPIEQPTDVAALIADFLAAASAARSP